MTRVARIGDATLYLGDSRAIVPDLGPLEVIVTDPPYGMRYRSKQRRHKAIANDDSAACLEWALTLEATHSKYIFCRWDNLRDFRPGTALPTSFITWVKNNWGAGDTKHAHGRQTEVVMFYPGPSHFFPVYRPSDVVLARKTANDNHPTEKPVELMDRVVGWTHGTVCDPFMGSGTTGVSCARLGRPFIGIELDPVHFETACSRIADAAAGPRMQAPTASQSLFPPAGKGRGRTDG